MIIIHVLFYLASFYIFQVLGDELALFSFVVK